MANPPIGGKGTALFEVSENSFITIFDVDASGTVTKLFPTIIRLMTMQGEIEFTGCLMAMTSMRPVLLEKTLVIVATRNGPIDYPELLRERGVDRLLSRLRRRLALSGEDWAMDMVTLQILPERPRTVRIDVDANLYGVTLYVDGSYVGELPNGLI